MDEPQDEIESAEQDRDMEALRVAVNQLCKHFDSVQIFGVRANPGGEGGIAATFGKGEWYARYGAAREWVLKSEHRMRREVDDE